MGCGLYGNSRAISKMTIHAPFDRIGTCRIEVVRAQVWIGDDDISIGVVVDVIAHGQVDPLRCSKGSFSFWLSITRQ